MKNLKKITALVLALAMAMSMAACGSKQEAAPAPAATEAAAETEAPAEEAAETEAAEAEAPAASADECPAVTSTEQVNIIWSHNAPEESSGHQTALKFKEEIETRTNGNVTITIYPNGQLGTVPENDQAMREGTIQMLSGTCGGTTDLRLSYLDAPNLVTSDEQALAVFGRGTDLRKLTEGLMEENSMVILSFMPAGYRQLSTNKKVEKYEDLQGLNIRVMENPVMMAYWKDWGCNATPVAFSELYIALQNGMVDAQENTFDTIRAAKLYEQQKYIVATNHVVMWAGMYMNKDFYYGLPEDYRAIIDWVCENVMDDYSYELSAKANDEALAEMTAAGCEFIELPEEDLVKMRENATSAYQLIRESVGDEIMDQVMAAVEAN